MYCVEKGRRDEKEQVEKTDTELYKTRMLLGSEKMWRQEWTG